MHVLQQEYKLHTVCSTINVFLIQLLSLVKKNKIKNPQYFQLENSKAKIFSHKFNEVYDVM